MTDIFPYILCILHTVFLNKKGRVKNPPLMYPENDRITVFCQYPLSLKSFFTSSDLSMPPSIAPFR